MEGAGPGAKVRHVILSITRRLGKNLEKVDQLNQAQPCREQDVLLHASCFMLHASRRKYPGT